MAGTGQRPHCSVINHSTNQASGAQAGRYQQGAPRATCQQAQGKTRLAKSFPSSSASCCLKSSDLGGTCVSHMSPLAVLTPPLLPLKQLFTNHRDLPASSQGWGSRKHSVNSERGRAPLSRQCAPEPTVRSHPLLYRRGSRGQPVQGPLTSSQQQGLVKPDSQIRALMPPTTPASPFSFFLTTWHGDLVPQPRLPCSSDGKESACNLGDLSSIPELGRSYGERNGKSLQYSCLENPIHRGSWQATQLDTN